jgi:DNA-binding NarL/FixJ family response regulator
MPRVSCLASVAPQDIELLTAALRRAGEPALSIVSHVNVAEMHRLAPSLVVADLDGLEVDALETLRQLRFVLPDCILAVYTAVTKGSWGRACHLAGANCLLSKESTELQLAAGLRSAIRGGCFTDPRFVA